MKKGIFTFVSAVSLVASLATLVMWALSSYHGYGVWAGRHDPDRFARPGTNVGVESVWGRIYLDAYYYEAGPSLAPTIQFKSWMVSPDGDSPEWRREHLRLGFGHMSYTRYRIHYYALFLPHWFVAFVLLAPPYFWWRRRRWVSNDVMACKTCSYNLTGNTSGVCPECGASLEQDASIRSVG